MELGTDKAACADGSLEQKVEVPPTKRRTVKLKLCKPNANACGRIIFATISTVTILIALTLIAVTVMISLATKIYDVEQSNRLVGMVVLAVSAAIVVSVLIYSNVGMFRSQKRPLHAMRLVLITLVTIQALVASFSLTMNNTDVEGLSKSLGNSFQLALVNNQRHVKLWAATQHDLTCCGVYGPDDYKIPTTPQYYPPNIPVSCCRSYNPNRSPLVQEKERRQCRTQKTYHNSGCLELVIKALSDTAVVVLGVAINLMVLELLCVICASIIIRKQKNCESEEGTMTK